MLTLQPLRETARERLRVLIRQGRVQRDVHLHSLRAGDLRERLQTGGVENLFQPERDRRAGEEVRAFARVEVECDGCGTVDVRRLVKEGVQLEIRGVGTPDEGGQIVDHDVADDGLSAAAWNVE